MDFTPIFDVTSKVPLYRQLYKQLSESIVAGEIPPGTKLPSIRHLVKSSDVGKITVEAAYQQRLAEGFIISRERSGFFAAEIEVWAEPQKQALSFLCLMLKDRHRVVAVKEPGYADARVVFSHHGFEVVPIPLSADGLSVESLERSGATVVYTTPSHQYPHGMIMPVAKRLRLLSWAGKAGGIIIENDCDGEFRYNVKPTPSLQGMDRHGSVVYIGNFSKAFSPALRMDYTILPPQLLARYLESFQAYPSPVPRHLQRTMQMFMQKGHWEKHIRKMRTVYHRKHALLLQAIKEFMPSEVRVLGHSAGLHILLEVETDRSEEQLIWLANRAGVHVYLSGRSWTVIPAGLHPRIIVGFGGMVEDQIPEGIRLLACAWFGGDGTYGNKSPL